MPWFNNLINFLSLTLKFPFHSASKLKKTSFSHSLAGKLKPISMNKKEEEIHLSTRTRTLTLLHQTESHLSRPENLSILNLTHCQVPLGKFSCEFRFSRVTTKYRWVSLEWGKEGMAFITQLSNNQTCRDVCWTIMRSPPPPTFCQLTHTHWQKSKVGAFFAFFFPNFASVSVPPPTHIWSISCSSITWTKVTLFRHLVVHCGKWRWQPRMGRPEQVGSRMVEQKLYKKIPNIKLIWF